MISVIFSFSFNFSNSTENLKTLFIFLFKDKNKVIDKNEMLKVLEALYDLTGVPDYERKGDQSVKTRVDMLMKKLDKNSNHVLEFEEFFDGCMEDDFIRKILIDPMFNC